MPDKPTHLAQGTPPRTPRASGSCWHYLGTRPACSGGGGGGCNGCGGGGGV